MSQQAVTGRSPWHSPPARGRRTLTSKCLQTNKVYAARYRHLTTRQTNKLKPTQAQTIIAAAILRQLYAVVVHRQAWDPLLATGGTKKAGLVTAA